MGHFSRGDRGPLLSIVSSVVSVVEIMRPFLILWRMHIATRIDDSAILRNVMQLKAVFCANTTDSPVVKLL